MKAIGLHNSKAQFIQVMAPSRSGKSSAIVPEAINTFIRPNANIWVVGIDYSTTHRFIFGEGGVPGVKTLLQDYMPFIIDADCSHKNEHRLENLNGSSIQGKSVKYPDSFVAERVDLIICEDAGSYPSWFWDQVLRKRVLDSGGRIILNSEPPLKISNYLLPLMKKADGVNWDFFNWGIRDNTNLQEEDIEKYIQDCPNHLKAAFIYGLPPETDSSVFGKVKDFAKGGFSGYVEGHMYQAGLDIGMTHDRTVHTISDITAGRCVFQDVFPAKFFRVDAVTERLLRNSEPYHLPLTYVDVTGIGQAFKGMVDSHRWMLPFEIHTLKMRNELINSLTLAFQRGYTIPELPYMIAELESLDLVMKVGHYIYKTQGGIGDDTIMSTALSIWGWASRMFVGGTNVGTATKTQFQVRTDEGADDVLKLPGYVDLTRQYR